MKRKYYIKVIGFRREQDVSIPLQEAHKVYYLFNNREKHGVFENGVAIVGSSIQQVVPDYNKTMGWNDSHSINNEDWNELRREGIEEKMEMIMEKARDVAKMMPTRPDFAHMTLGNIIVNNNLLPENELLRLS